MPRACSADLRERVLAAYEAGEGRQAEMARRFRISERTVSRWLRAVRIHGRREPKAPGHRRAPLDGQAAALAELVAEKNDATLARVRRAADSGDRGSAQPCRGLSGAQGHGPCAEEKTLRAAEQDWEDVARARAAWRAELAGIDPRRLVFLDESGIDTRLTRTYGRACRGRRALGKVPWGSWKRLTIIGALALDGVVAAMSIAAATSTAVFLAFVEQVLVPALRDRPDAIVVMDNLGAQGPGGPGGARLGWAEPSLPAAPRSGPGQALLARPEPDRASLVQAQGQLARHRHPLGRGAGSGPRPRARHHLRPGCNRLVPPRRLHHSRQLKCKLL